MVWGRLHDPRDAGQSLQGGEDTPYPEWVLLLESCEEFAILAGWRFVLVDFMRMDIVDGSVGSEAEAKARQHALPMALTYADRVAELVRAPSAVRANSQLFREFNMCQRLVAAEAVFNSMVATCRALGLLPLPSHSQGAAAAKASTGSAALRPAPSADAKVGASGSGSPLPSESQWQDTSQPLPLIAARLANYSAALDAYPSASAQRRERLLRASFVTDFGLEHGLPELRDATCEAMLREFLERVRDWGGADADSTAMVRALVLDELGQRDSDSARESRTSKALARGEALRALAVEWFDENRGTALIGGAIVAGALGVLVAGIAILAAGAAKRQH